MSPEQDAGFHIFISYRRDGGDIHAGRLYDALRAGVDDTPGFAADQIFMDIDTLKPGDDFREKINENVAKCDVLLAVIGKQWATVRDTKRQRRLENPGDYVRLEIEAALERKVPVVPILVYGAKMPRETELPKSISALVYREASELTHKRYREDVGRLLATLKEREQEKAGPTQSGKTKSTRKRKSATARKAKSGQNSPSNTPSTPPQARQEQQQPKPADASSALIDLLQPRRYNVGDIFDGRVIKTNSGEAIVLIDTIPERKYGRISGGAEFHRDGLKFGWKLKTYEGGALIGKDDMVRVKITHADSSPSQDGLVGLSFVEMLPQGTMIGRYLVWPLSPD